MNIVFLNGYEYSVMLKQHFLYKDNNTFKDRRIGTGSNSFIFLRLNNISNFGFKISIYSINTYSK